MTTVQVTGMGGIYSASSDWVLPTFGEPRKILSGLIGKSDFQGFDFLQVWPKSAPYCDHVISKALVNLSGSYWNASKREPIVVLPWSDVPRITDKSNPTGQSVWPPPGVQVKDKPNAVVKVLASGHFPSEAVNITDSPGCDLTLHLDGTAAWFWTMKGMVTVERSPDAIVRIVCGQSKSTTVIRFIGSANPTCTLHSGVSSCGRSGDSGMAYLVARHKGLDGFTRYSEAGGNVLSYARSAPDRVGVLIDQLGLPFTRADVMLDDWWRGAAVDAEGSVYLCGPDNFVRASHTIVDPRSGKEWDAAKAEVPWFAAARGTAIEAGSVEIL